MLAAAKRDGLRGARELELTAEQESIQYTPSSARLHMTPADVTHRWYRIDCRKPPWWDARERKRQQAALKANGKSRPLPAFPQRSEREQAEASIGQYIRNSAITDDTNVALRRDAFKRAEAALRRLHGIGIFFARHALRWMGWVCGFEDPRRWWAALPGTQHTLRSPAHQAPDVCVSPQCHGLLCPGAGPPSHVCTSAAGRTQPAAP